MSILYVNFGWAHSACSCKNYTFATRFGTSTQCVLVHNMPILHVNFKWAHSVCWCKNYAFATRFGASTQCVLVHNMPILHVNLNEHTVCTDVQTTHLQLDSGRAHSVCWGIKCLFCTSILDEHTVCADGKTTHLQLDSGRAHSVC